MAVNPARGEIRVARLNFNQGGEISKTPPILVLQATELSRANLPTLVMAPSTQLRADTEPLRVRIAAWDRLLKLSYVCV